MPTDIYGRQVGSDYRAKHARYTPLLAILTILVGTTLLLVLISLLA